MFDVSPLRSSTETLSHLKYDLEHVQWDIEQEFSLPPVVITAVTSPDAGELVGVARRRHGQRPVDLSAVRSRGRRHVDRSSTDASSFTIFDRRVQRFHRSKFGAQNELMKGIIVAALSRGTLLCTFHRASTHVSLKRAGERNVVGVSRRIFDVHGIACARVEKWGRASGEFAYGGTCNFP